MAVAVFVHVFWCVLRGDIPIPSLVGGIFPHLSSPLHLVSVNCVGSRRFKGEHSIVQLQQQQQHFCVLLFAS